jgi:hypothetical protein
MSYQSQLDKLMQMATIEQLKDLMRQFNNNISESEKEKEKSFSNQEILSLPIVQKVVFAYEEELKAAKNRLYQGDSQCSCHTNNTELFNRLDEQDKLFTDMFFKMEDKMNELSNDIRKLNIILNVSNQSSHFVATKPVISEHEVVEHVIESIVPDEQVVTSEPIMAHDVVVTAAETIVADDIVVAEQVNIKLEIQEIVDNNLNQHIDDTEYIIVENNFDILEDDESVISEEAEETVISEEAEGDEGDEGDEGETEEAVESDEVEETEEAVEESESEDNIVDELVEEAEAEADEVVEADESVDEADELEETDEEVATDDADAEDEEVFEIEIDDITYFATDEENGILYEVTKTGEVGKKVGIIKDGEPIFS